LLVLLFTFIITSYISTALSQTFSKLNLWRSQNKSVENHFQQIPISTSQLPANVWTCITQPRNSNADGIQSKQNTEIVGDEEEFSLNAASDEDFELQLQDHQKQAILNALSKEQVSPRLQRIQSLYAIRSVSEWKAFINDLPDGVCKHHYICDIHTNFLSKCHHLPSLLKTISGSIKTRKPVTMQTIC